MRFSLNWIKEYVPLRQKPEVIARVLTERAFETEIVPESVRAELDSVIAVRVCRVEKHPHADRLSIVTIDIGKGKTTSVVCGAPNVHEEMMSAFVGPGGKVCSAEGNVILVKEANIRGVQSFGMLCSERELGFSDRHDAVLELAPDIKVGTKLSTLFPKDALLEVDILPDRAADCSSHTGIAREIAALLGKQAKLPSFKRVPRRASSRIMVRQDQLQGCMRYVAVSLKGISNGTSPHFIQKQLLAIGIRPQNLIIDVTNYVLWETGQPTHAFDARHMGITLGVRKAKKGDKSLRTLDGETRRLTSDMLVVTSDDVPIALAGVMGGFETAVQGDTDHVIIESALFARSAVRKTVRATGLRTDASDRFSRGLTSTHVDIGLSRVVELLAKYGGGKVCGYAEYAPARHAERLKLFVSHEHIEQVLGMDVSASDVTTILRALGFQLQKAKGGYSVYPPDMRHDIMIPEDVIEEVGRVLGYNSIPSVLPHAPITAFPLPSSVWDTRAIQDALSGTGWTEVFAYSFVPEEETEVTGMGNIEHIGVVNPMHENQRRLRLSLIPGMLRFARSEIKREPLIRFFEVGTVYPAGNKEEKWVVGMLARRAGERQDDFYEVKGAVEHIMHVLHVSDARFRVVSPSPKRSPASLWREGGIAEVVVGGKEIGTVGIIADDILEKLAIRGSVVIFSLNLSAIERIQRIERVYNPPLPYPVVRRDMSFALPDGVLVDDVFAEIQKTGGSLIQDIDMVDMHERGVTVRVLFGSPKRTLTDKEVSLMQRKICSQLFDRLNVTERE